MLRFVGVEVGRLIATNWWICSSMANGLNMNRLKFQYRKSHNSTFRKTKIK